MARFTESVVEDAALAWLEGLGYAVAARPGDRARRARRGARDDYATCCWTSGCARPRAAQSRLPAEALDDAYRKLTRPRCAVAGRAQPRACTGCWSMA